jgi:transcription elongation factor
MKIYSVINKDTGYNEVFHRLTAAKAAMKANNARGYISTIRSNGDTISHGEIMLAGSNKTFTANTRQKTKNY